VRKLALLDPTDCFAGLRMSYRLPDRLRASTVPTLLLLAEKSRAHDIHKVSANARKLIPHMISTTLPDVSHHAMPTELPERLNRELGTFLNCG
jgi:pimeloyl-ACP methyl ester carboxylesterase